MIKSMYATLLVLIIVDVHLPPTHISGHEKLLSFPNTGLVIVKMLNLKPTNSAVGYNV